MYYDIVYVTRDKISTEETVSDNRMNRGNRSGVRGGNRPSSQSQYHRHQEHGAHGRRLIPAWLLIVLDILFLGVALNVFAILYSLPSTFEGTKVIGKLETKAPAPTTSPIATPAASPTANESATAGEQTAEPTATPEPVDLGMWGEKFADKFATGDPEQTEASYKSKDINVTVTKVQEDNLTYFVADIYVRNLQNFRTVLANDTLGKSQRESQESMAKRSGAIISINTDNYGDLDDGYCVKNGELARETAFDDILVLYTDGTMKTYLKGKYNLEDINDAWQVWSFGPQLLQDGETMETFNSRVNPVNPRSAMGYYEPGHYCFVVVDGRQGSYSEGLTLKEMSQLMKSLGCTVAYNMDGGQSSMMFFMGKLVNKPYKDGRVVTDIAIIGEAN